MNDPLDIRQCRFRAGAVYCADWGACGACGWNPAVERKRKARARDELRRRLEMELLRREAARRADEDL